MVDTDTIQVNKLKVEMLFFLFQAGNKYMLREFSTRESSIAELKVSYDTSCTDNKGHLWVEMIKKQKITLNVKPLS